MQMRQMGQVHSATPPSVGRARRAVSEFAGGVGGDSATISAIELAVSEACANVTVHAYRDSDSPGEMVVLASESHGSLEVRVIDHGIGLTPRFDSPGIGMGLPLMSSLADSFEAQSSEEAGTEIRMQFTLGRPEGAA